FQAYYFNDDVDFRPDEIQKLRKKQNEFISIKSSNEDLIVDEVLSENKIIENNVEEINKSSKEKIESEEDNINDSKELIENQNENINEEKNKTENLKTELNDDYE
ncbi:MAG: hypothetical protein E6936_16505, partial [Clostridium perfringens]|nr:hypothetical protein [Clostridium perfringens]